MRATTFTFFLILFCCTSDGKAQRDTAALEDRFYRHKYENDFFTATDRYYTQGVYLEFIFPAFRKTLLAKTLIKLKPRSGKAINYYGISTERQGFTPSSIRHFGKPIYGERPYAAIVYITHLLVSLAPNERLRLTTRINLGFMGSNLFGEEEQVAIHTSLGNILPLGWEYQIENDYVINYDIFLEKGLIDSKWLTLTGFAELRVGTLYDDFSLGSMIRIGYMQPYFNNLGLTRKKTAQKFQCYLFLRGKAKAVGYNASMQGGVINQNSSYVVPDSYVERLVGQASYGLAISYKRVGFEYSLASITKEYKIGKNHAWGRIGINVCF